MKRTLLLGAALALALSFSAFAKPSGTLTVGEVADCSTLNPIVSEDTTESEILNCIFEGLFRQSNKTDLIPSLATEVPTKANGGVSKDEKTYTFHLRKGVKWSDGKPFTAKDVKFTYEAIMNDKVAVPSRDPYDKIKTFTIVDDYTIKMTLSEFVPEFLLSWSGPLVMPAHAFEGLTGDKLAEALGKAGTFSRKPIGTGPYKLKEWKSGSYIAIEPNDSWWGGDPGIDNIVFKVLADQNTVATQMKTGEVQYGTIQPAQYDQLKSVKGIDIVKYARAAYLHLTFNLKNEILADRAVRQALAYATPRQLIVDNILKGVGSVSGSPISPVSWAYNDKVEKAYPLDPKKAKTLLDRDGWKLAKDGFRYKDGKKLTFSIMTNAGNPTREAIAPVLKEYWKEIGADLKLNIIEWNTMNEKLDALDFDIVMSAWVTSSNPDAYSLFYSTQIPTKANGGEGQNYAQYVNKDMDKLIELSRATNDRDQRKLELGKIQELVVRDLPMLPVYNYQQYCVIPEGLANFKPSPFTNTNFWNVYEWKLK